MSVFKTIANKYVFKCDYCRKSGLSSPYKTEQEAQKVYDSHIKLKHSK